MLSFLKSIHDALDNESSTETVAFYTDFSKAFDKVPHFELVQKSQILEWEVAYKKLSLTA